MKPTPAVTVLLLVLLGCSKAPPAAPAVDKPQAEALLRNVRKFRDKMDDFQRDLAKRTEKADELYRELVLRGGSLPAADKEELAGARKLAGDQLSLLESLLRDLGRVDRDLSRAIDGNDAAGVADADARYKSLLEKFSSELGAPDSDSVAR